MTAPTAAATMVHFPVFPMNGYGHRLRGRPACGAPRASAMSLTEVTCPACLTARAARQGAAFDGPAW